MPDRDRGRGATRDAAPRPTDERVPRATAPSLVLALALAAALTGCLSHGDPSPAIRLQDVATTEPGERARIAFTAEDVGEIRVASLPDVGWSDAVGFDDVAPRPTSVRESEPPQLAWDPHVARVGGTVTVDVGEAVPSGRYGVTVAASLDGRRSAATATVVVE